MNTHINLGTLPGYTHDVLALLLPEEDVPTDAEYVDTYSTLPGTYDVLRLPDGRYVVVVPEDPESR